MQNTVVINHPLVQHKLSLIRNKMTSIVSVRFLMQEISHLLAYEVTKDFPVIYSDIETPVSTMKAPFIDDSKIVLISIMRAGSALVSGILQLIPSASVGIIGLRRDEKTLEVDEYYFKAPSLKGKDVIIADPMLATGHTIIHAVKRFKNLGANSIKVMCLISAPEGIENFHKVYPEIKIYTASIDQKLNEKGYIVPGLGDAGDRLFGTL